MFGPYFENLETKSRIFYEIHHNQDPNKTFLRCRSLEKKYLERQKLFESQKVFQRLMKFNKKSASLRAKKNFARLQKTETFFPFPVSVLRERNFFIQP